MASRKASRERSRTDSESRTCFCASNTWTDRDCSAWNKRVNASESLMFHTDLRERSWDDVEVCCSRSESYDCLAWDVICRFEDSFASREVTRSFNIEI
jgi:hypothetical protein